MEAIILLLLIAAWVVTTRWLKKEVKKRNEERQKKEQEEQERRENLYLELLHLVKQIQDNTAATANIYDYTHKSTENPA